MNPITPTVWSRRRIWPWVVSLCVAPLVILGIAALSFLTLDNDGAALKRQVMIATGTEWRTKVQVSAGRLTLGAVWAGLAFTDRKEFEDARLALESVSRISVGVYERTATLGEPWSRQKLRSATDETMHRRGWSRLVGVMDHKEAVLIYVPQKYSSTGPIDLCLAVVNERELVVVATTVNPEGLAELIAKHAGDDWRRGLKLAKN